MTSIATLATSTLSGSRNQTLNHLRAH